MITCFWTWTTADHDPHCRPMLLLNNTIWRQFAVSLHGVRLDVLHDSGTYMGALTETCNTQQLMRHRHTFHVKNFCKLTDNLLHINDRCKSINTAKHMSSADQTGSNCCLLIGSWALTMNFFFWQLLPNSRWLPGTTFCSFNVFIFNRDKKPLLQAPAARPIT